jgi:hypothetical protein
MPSFESCEAVEWQCRSTRVVEVRVIDAPSVGFTYDDEFPGPVQPFCKEAANAL